MSQGSLLERCRDRGFTPGARDVAGLLELWRELGAAAEAKVVVQALCRGQGGVALELERGLAQAEGHERAMRLRVLARISRSVELDSLTSLLDAGLCDPEPRVVREAARAIAKLDEDTAAPYEDALVRVARDAALPERRAAVEALGQIGGDAAHELLRELSELAQELDRDLARRVTRARTMIERRAARRQPPPLTLDRPAPEPALVRLRCRGAAQLVAEEARARLSSRELLALEPGDSRTLSLRWSGPVAALDSLRTPLDWGLVFPLPPGDELAARIVAGVESPALADTLVALTDGPVRFRLTLVDQGARRALIWAVAQALDAREATLRNDSRAVSWTVEVDEARASLTCVPRRQDPRFDYRVAHIPASSHPTLAALMARVAAPRPGELVWDPFCGCGAELVECSKLAADLELLGTDHDPQAIAAARANVAAAGLDGARVRVEAIDVFTGSPAPATAGIIVTNPPMGRRAALGEGLHDWLRRFVAHAARVLAPGGRLVWVTPAARVTAEAAAAAGLRVNDLGPIDMSGMRVVLQVLRRPPGAHR